MGELSKAEKLLVASGLLAADGKNPFGTEDLAVKAHERFPNDFSLKGYPHYPDNNAVLTQLMGKKAPLVVRGWLEKTGTKRYRLTAKGVHDLEELDSDQGTAASIYVDRSLEDDLGRLLTSPAFELFRDGKEEEITFHQFCRFAGLSARDKWQKVSAKLATLEHNVAQAVKIGESGQTLKLHFRKRNRRYSPEELRLLDALLKFVLRKFSQEMTQWREHAGT